MFPGSMNDAQYGLLFDVRRSIRYHDRRRAFFERMHRVTSVMTILLAGSVLFELGRNGETALWLQLLGLAAALLAAMDMVVGYSSHANTHRDLRHRFNTLEQDIIKGGDSEPEWSAFHLMRLEIEREEPPVYRALDLLCHNELAVAEGHPKEQIYPVPTLQRYTSQFFHWSDIAHG